MAEKSPTIFNGELSPLLQRQKTKDSLYERQDAPNRHNLAPCSGEASHYQIQPTFPPCYLHIMGVSMPLTEPCGGRGERHLEGGEDSLEGFGV